MRRKYGKFIRGQETSARTQGEGSSQQDRHARPSVGRMLHIDIQYPLSLALTP